MDDFLFEEDSERLFYKAEKFLEDGNYSDAEKYFKKSAENGNSEIKLKVAEKFDMPFSGENPILDYTVVRYLCNEVIDDGDDDLKLMAARRLDRNMMREALDINKAYLTYRILGNRGYKEACMYAGYCCEIGKGTKKNIDLAVILYEKAGEMEKMNWCICKKENKLDFDEYKRRLNLNISKNINENNSMGIEYYNKNIDFNIYEYMGRVYYIKYSNGKNYVCSSDTDGNDVKIVSKIYKDNSFECIFVNNTGIFLYTHHECGLCIQHIGFDKQLKGEYKEWTENFNIKEYMHTCVYIYGNKVYFSYILEDKEQEYKICQIEFIDIDNGICKVIYDKASDIKRLLATENKVIFLATYANEGYNCTDEYGDRYIDEDGKTGWMILDTTSNDIECISNPYCNMENVIISPDVYNTESNLYNDKCNFDRNIIFFDLNRNVFWNRYIKKSGIDSFHLKDDEEYWVPHDLWGDRDDIAKGMPIWKMNTMSKDHSREYFDGLYHFFSDSYSEFESSDKYGKVFNWTEGNLHGECEKFKVFGDYLYLDTEAFNEHQYCLGEGILMPRRRSWFMDDLPEDLIMEFDDTDK